ncbi:MAG: YIP1 family protein [Gemmatimonadota bacterium]|nr:YIP1 family protein [Gemmatimonadota bacterium]
MNQNTSAHTAQSALPNLLVRVVRVFIAPASLFDALRERPVWLDALLVTIVVGLLVQFMIPAEMIRDAIVSGLPADASPEQIEGAERMAGLSSSFGWVMTIVWPLLLFTFLAGLLKLVYGALLGGPVTFRQMFSATAHAQLINTAGAVITLPLIRATGDLRSTLSLHLLVPELERDGWLFGFLQGLSLFGLWTMIVLGLAVSRISPKVSATSAVAFLVGGYVLVKAVFAFAPAAG